jgi:putative membrane protein
VGAPSIFILFVSRVMNRSHIDQNSDDETETPLEILKKRYARGEIEKEDFNEKRQDLLN